MYPRVGNRPSPYTFFVYLPFEDVFPLGPSLCLCLLVEGQLKQAWDQVRGDVLNSIISFPLLLESSMVRGTCLCGRETQKLNMLGNPYLKIMH